MLKLTLPYHVWDGMQIHYIRCYCKVAWNEVKVEVTVLAMNTSMPQLPDARLLSVAVTIQVPGLLPVVGQTLAARLLPVALKSNVYEVPGVAVKA